MSAKIMCAPPPDCLWLAQAAERLGVQPRTLYTWRQRRVGPAGFRYLGRIVYRITVLDAYLAECEAADSHSNPALDPVGRTPESDIRIPAPRSHRRKKVA